MKWLLKIIGMISLILGILGCFLPVLPTTPFLLLTASLWAKSSDKWYRWLMNHPRLGTYIRNFQEYKCLPVRVKVVILSVLWLTLAISFFAMEALWVKILLCLVGVGVTIHILSYKSR